MLNAVLTASSASEATMELWQVVVLGVGIVFVGLICIIILCTVTGKIIPMLEKSASGSGKTIAPAVAAPVAESIPNRQELVAAVSCALAEEMGADVSAIRIVSLRKI